MKKKIIIISVVIVVIILAIWAYKRYFSSMSAAQIQNIAGGHIDVANRQWICKDGTKLLLGKQVNDALVAACKAGSGPTGRTRVATGIPEHPEGVKQHEERVCQLDLYEIVTGIDYVHNKCQDQTGSGACVPADIRSKVADLKNNGYQCVIGPDYARCYKVPSCKCDTGWVADTGQQIVQTTQPKGKG